MMPIAWVSSLLADSQLVVDHDSKALDWSPSHPRPISCTMSPSIMIISRHVSAFSILSCQGRMRDAIHYPFLSARFEQDFVYLIVIHLHTFVGLMPMGWPAVKPCVTCLRDVFLMMMYLRSLSASLPSPWYHCLGLQASPSLGGGHGLSLSVRDLLSWAGFMTSSGLLLRPWEAYVHGAALVLLDGIGLGAGLSPQSVARLRTACAKALKDHVRHKRA